MQTLFVWVCVLLQQALASLCLMSAQVRASMQGSACACAANLSKQVFVIASGWMTFGTSLESPVTSCGGDRGQEGKELTENAGKTLAVWINVFFFFFKSIVCGMVLLSMLAPFQHHPASYSCTCTQSHLAAAQQSTAILYITELLRWSR